MPLLDVVLILTVVGVLLYLFNRFVTFIDGTIKQIINIVVILAVCLWLLQVFGVFGGLRAIRVGP